MLVHNAITKKTREAVRQKNRDKNGGILKCNVCGIECVLGKRHKRGETPPSNEVQMGHQISRKNGGSDTEDNLEIECRKCNRANGANNR